VARQLSDIEILHLEIIKTSLVKNKDKKKKFSKTSKYVEENFYCLDKDDTECTAFYNDNDVIEIY
jgi:hypothetical protein